MGDSKGQRIGVITFAGDYAEEISENSMGTPRDFSNIKKPNTETFCFSFCHLE